MGIMNFLQQQGFIATDGNDAAKSKTESSPASQQSAPIAPTFFPVLPTIGNNASADADEAPSFVAPLPQTATSTASQQQLDPTFVKFFEDELVKANLPGPDYFEFRQQLTKTTQKMAAKGVNASEVILQAVMMSFETQDISPAKLIDAAQQYKTILKQKNDDFLKGAAAEKANQLQKRQGVLQTHTENIKKIEQQLQQLELQKKQLDDAINKEKTQLEVNKSLGKEGIEKIERAEQLIAFAHNYIQSTIDTDISRLKSV